MTDLPSGFLAAGRNLGVKNRKPDCGLIWTEAPASWAAVLTRNRSRACNIDRIQALSERGGSVRGILAVSGNANALTGARGRQDDQRLAASLAHALGVAPDQILTTYTGIIGHPLPVQRLERGLPKLLEQLSDRVEPFADSILTTDRVRKVSHREVFIDGVRTKLCGVVKGAGMIAPSMATMLGYVMTDARVSGPELQRVLTEANESTFNMLTVDNDMSTNDAVVAVSSGRSGGPWLSGGSSALALFQDALTDLLAELTRAVASDGEGATRRFEVVVRGAEDARTARTMARAVVNSPLVKTAIFGADPNAGSRIVATAGAVAATSGAAFDLEKLELRLQQRPVVKSGALVWNDPEVRTFMQADLVEAELDLHVGSHEARAFGCDLSYDYVKINADYAGASGSVSAKLAEQDPDQKRALLIEALRYIDRFRGIRAVIKIGGAAMVDPELEAHFAESVILLRNVGLRPIVVHGGGPEISRHLKALGQEPRFVDGLRVTDVEAMGVVEMVLTGSVNQRLVAALNNRGARAVGLSGKDGGLVEARKHRASQDLGFVGEVSKVDPSLIDLLEEKGYIPVVSPVGLGEGGAAFNINADVVAARLASACRAAKLIYLSDVPGLLQGDQVVSELTGDQLKVRLERGEIKGGMKPKLESALHALRTGVHMVHLVDGRVPHNLIAELFTDKGVGTLIRQS
ncbi:MAG: bifunctional glutamate N-acetyltransferase/amino-acid acetyltransferase ArgJ [Myxococcota bacterium]